MTTWRAPSCMAKSVLFAFAVLNVSCGGTPTSPAPPETPPPPPPLVTRSRVVSAIGTQGALSGVRVVAEGLAEATTSDTGEFQLTAPAEGTYAIRLIKEGFIERRTSLKIPGESATLSLIPSDFNLAAFDEFIYRREGLYRWTTAPSLQIEESIIDFRDGLDNRQTRFRGSDRVISAQRAACIRGILEPALRDLTGGTFEFTGVRVVRTPDREWLDTKATPLGTIMVLTARNLFSNGMGFAYSSETGWRVERGVLFLHADWVQPCDTRMAPLLIHELGHSLAYGLSHVFKAPSIMGSPPSTSLTVFDRDAITIAYQRPPGNTSPDTDPAGFVANVRETGPPAVWTALNPEP